MVQAQASRRTGFTGSALTRLLARLTDIDVPESRQAFADRLSHWVSWTDAISLSTALNGNPATAPAASTSSNDEEGECARVRASLVNAITEGSPLAADFAPYRQRYLARQQAMEAAIGPLRSRLRAKLAARSPDLARLVAVDAVMEQALDAHEHRLLATVPGLLEKHFKRLRQAAQQQAGSDDEVPPDAWQDAFRKNMQDVLLAELDIRFQPIEGLLETLRSS
jgi:hypothetical protein